MSKGKRKRKSKKEGAHGYICHPVFQDR